MITGSDLLKAMLIMTVAVTTIAISVDYAKEYDYNNRGKTVNQIDININTPKQNIIVPVSKVIEIKNNAKEKKKSFIYFEELDDGTFRMTYTTGMFKGEENDKKSN